MAQSPEELKRDIEQTRRELTTDVDLLNEKVSPSRIVGRRVDKTRGAVSNLKDRVMGTASSGTSGVGDRASNLKDRVMGTASSGTSAMGDRASSMTSNVSSAASSVGDAVSSAPETAIQRAQGNPLAAGLLAFAGGWLVSSLLPATKVEQQAAQAVQDKASDYAEPVKEQAKQVAMDMKDQLQEPAQQAVQSVKESATDAAGTVKAEGQSAAQNVSSEAQSSAQNVKDAQQSS
jgi:hypothetical protein